MGEPIVSSSAEILLKFSHLLEYRFSFAWARYRSLGQKIKSMAKENIPGSWCNGAGMIGGVEPLLAHGKNSFRK